MRDKPSRKPRLESTGIYIYTLYKNHHSDLKTYLYSLRRFLSYIENNNYLYMLAGTTQARLFRMHWKVSIVVFFIVFGKRLTSTKEKGDE